MNALTQFDAWCILRTSGAATLRLADSLARAQYEAWAPREQLPKRKGRERVRRTTELAIMPTYVFARAVHLVDLLELSQSPASPHPDFAVFRHLGRFPLIADETLGPLRVAERRKLPFDQVAKFTQGELVKVFEGGFAGLSGVVELTRGQFTMVAFPGFPMPIKIKTLLLLSDIPQVQRRAA